MIDLTKPVMSSPEWTDAIAKYRTSHDREALYPAWKEEVVRLSCLEITAEREPQIVPLFQHSWSPYDAAKHLRTVWFLKGWIGFYPPNPEGIAVLDVRLQMKEESRLRKALVASRRLKPGKNRAKLVLAGTFFLAGCHHQRVTFNHHHDRNSQAETKPEQAHPVPADVTHWPIPIAAYVVCTGAPSGDGHLSEDGKKVIIPLSEGRAILVDVEDCGPTAPKPQGKTK